MAYIHYLPRAYPHRSNLLLDEINQTLHGLIPGYLESGIYTLDALSKGYNQFSQIFGPIFKVALYGMYRKLYPTIFGGAVNTRNVGGVGGKGGGFDPLDWIGKKGKGLLGKLKINIPIRMVCYYVRNRRKIFLRGIRPKRKGTRGDRRYFQDQRTFGG